MKFKLTNRVKQLAAFSLAELVVATGIMAFLFATVFLVLVQGVGVIQAARENLRATQIIQEVTEVLRLYSWSQVTSGGYIPTSFTNYFDPSSSVSNRGVAYYGQITIQPPSFSDASYTNSLREVVVTVNWTNKSIPHSKSLITLSSKYGIQRYIY